MFKNPTTYAAQLLAAFPAGTHPEKIVAEAILAYPQAPQSFWADVLKALDPVKVLVEAVKAHAKANYEKDGWDFLVECWSDEEIAEKIQFVGATIGAAKTPAQAIKKIGRILKLQDERRREVRAEIF